LGTGGEDTKEALILQGSIVYLAMI
jgi:hypothetical protein